jgi:subtilisin family serine protease
MRPFYKIMAIAMLFAVLKAQAQHSIYISVRDHIISAVTVQGKPIFSVTAINTLVDQYTVTDFEKAFPTSRLRYMRSVYKMNVSDLALPQALVNNYPEYFSQWEMQPQLIPAFTPNDYASIPGFRNTGYLDYINAEDAWDVSRGSPNIVIGVHDWQLDVTHPDLVNKIASVTNNVTIPSDHGTNSVGLIAAQTHNGIGYPSIGDSCMIDFTGCTGGNPGQCFGMLQTSQRRRRIMNMSAAGDCGSDTLYHPPWYKTIDQHMYREIYENGTFLVASAGNRYGQARYYCYPASYDYVFSVSGVGWRNPYGGSINTNVEDLHEEVRGDSNTTFQHNPRVDLLAPAYEIGALVRQPTSYLEFGPGGTSSAAPLVTGTAGLILSEDSCYTPYQLEYILKKSAKSSVLTRSENLKYAGKLGAGALDAGRALAMVDTLNPGTNPSIPFIDCNHTATQTLFIEGIDINTICVPGYTSNGAKPKLKPIIRNGTPPYTYKWEALSFNMAMLNSYTIDTPQIDAVSGVYIDGTSIVHLLLTVYDNSPVQKVASREFYFDLKADTAKFDLAGRDSYMDMLNEANRMDTLDQRDDNYFLSQDLWNRQTSLYNEVHQNAEYVTIDSNYAFVRIKNYGCKRYDATASQHYLKIYWTVASTGEKWKTDWDGTRTVNGAAGGLVPGGGPLTSGSGIPIPSLDPGQTAIISKGWRPVRPQDYEHAPTDLNVCLLARIVNASDGGMRYAEQLGPIITNVRNNNNIFTRNLWVKDINPANRHIKTRIFVANAGDDGQLFDVQFINDRTINPHFAGNYSAVGFVKLHLHELYDVWMAAGGMGHYLERSEEERWVTIDGSQTLELLELLLPADTQYPVDVEFILHEGIPIPDYRFDFHLRQFVVADGARSEDVYGSMSFQINTSNEGGDLDIGRKALIQNEEPTTSNFRIYPNPAKEYVMIAHSGSEAVEVDLAVLDMVGRRLYGSKQETFNNTQKKLDLSGYVSGVYLVSITYKDGTSEQLKFVKQ